MSAANWKQIRLFVEGGDDLTFAKRVLEPRLKGKYNHVQIHTHANISDDDLMRHFGSLERMGSDFFLLVDYDRGPCIAEVRKSYAKRYKPYLGETQVLVVRSMIEAWYVAGVPSGNPFKASIPPTVDSVDKQAFAQIFGKRAESRTERRVLLQQILAVYDWGLALQRSESLRYCATRLGIAP